MKSAPSHRLQLTDLITGSENSRLIGYTFESKTLRLQVFHPTAGLVSFQIPTDTVHGRSVPTDRRRASCRIELINLSKTLTVVEGRYAPPTDLNQFLRHAQTRTTLAYGRRASEYRWLMLLRGEYPLLACLIGDLAEIEWTTE